MKVDGWVMPINDFLFIYLFSSLLNTRATHYCVIRGFRFVKLRTHPKQTKKNREQEINNWILFFVTFFFLVKYFLR